ncbi:MAG: secondary thiamine-phosphate synthase enzyme YjbQ [Sulfolobales archaeon]|nr:secondary thiamine-phosphate synthase enzyme YjbQ [Sulfolobales archaeon]MDW8083362.1 secondary thiamine-phosphate synthase enzyme YjbQ [Sulfolobales archaeon]
MGYHIYWRKYSIDTKSKFEVVKLTKLVEDTVRESGIKDGYVLVFIPHTTAAIAINEYEPRILEDYIVWIKKEFSPGGGWKHDEIDDNAHAHIASLVIGQSKMLPISGGHITRGTWQEVLLLEFDGPRRRDIFIQVHGIRQDLEKEAASSSMKSANVFSKNSRNQNPNFNSSM